MQMKSKKVEGQQTLHHCVRRCQFRGKCHNSFFKNISRFLPVDSGNERSQGVDDSLRSVRHTVVPRLPDRGRFDRVFLRSLLAGAHQAPAARRRVFRSLRQQAVRHGELLPAERDVPPLAQTVARQGRGRLSRGIRLVRIGPRLRGRPALVLAHPRLFVAHRRVRGERSVVFQLAALLAGHGRPVAQLHAVHHDGRAGQRRAVRVEPDGLHGGRVALPAHGPHAVLVLLPPRLRVDRLALGPGRRSVSIGPLIRTHRPRFQSALQPLLSVRRIFVSRIDLLVQCQRVNIVSFYLRDVCVHKVCVSLLEAYGQYIL